MRNHNKIMLNKENKGLHFRVLGSKSLFPGGLHFCYNPFLSEGVTKCILFTYALDFFDD